MDEIQIFIIYEGKTTEHLVPRLCALNHLYSIVNSMLMVPMEEIFLYLDKALLSNCLQSGERTLAECNIWNHSTIRAFRHFDSFRAQVQLPSSTIQINLHPLVSGEEVKHILFILTGIPPAIQSLSYFGFHINTKSTMKSLRIGSDSVLSMFPSYSQYLHNLPETPLTDFHVSLRSPITTQNIPTQFTGLYHKYIANCTPTPFTKTHTSFTVPSFNDDVFRTIQLGIVARFRRTTISLQKNHKFSPRLAVAQIRVDENDSIQFEMLPGTVTLDPERIEAQFEPKSELEPGNVFRVDVTPFSKSGQSHLAFRFLLFTEPFLFTDVIQHTPAHGDCGIAPNTPISVTFSDPLKPSSLQQVVYVEPVPSTPLAFSLSEDGTTVTISPSEDGWPKDCIVTAAVNPFYQHLQTTLQWPTQFQPLFTTNNKFITGTCSFSFQTST
ncbi:hypothetical protein BLNAU_12268 [Blattamonas nauphoetae]|uniref:SbsA Ig-like domain-containing protein n=1 Tax=Blattamonas nauphoetae TaxID=2049346 RepID=A0ABQ9XNK8_9EUKA|nr:hypothetical protein BLNAU_12268 [Blattamonas nauphoetae]